MSHSAVASSRYEVSSAPECKPGWGQHLLIGCGLRLGSPRGAVECAQ